MTDPQPAWQDPSANPPPAPAAFPAPEPVNFAPAPTFGTDPYPNPVQPAGADAQADPARPAGAESQSFGGEQPTAVVPQPVSADPYVDPAAAYVVPAAQPGPYGYAQPGQYGPPGQYGYAQPGPYGYPAYPPAPTTNGLAIGSMVVSISALVFLACYGFGGLIGVIGAILGHVSRRQIRERGESGEGLALAGIIIGWTATAIGLLIVAFIAFLLVVTINAESSTAY